MGKYIVVSIVVASAIFGWIIFSVLKSVPQLSNQVSAQLKNDFISYVTSQKKQTQFLVAELPETKSSFYIDLNQDLKFEIQDQTVAVTAPPIYEVPAAASAEISALNKGKILEAARSQVSEFILGWLKQKFIKDQKKIKVQLRFADENPK